jgi:hypothetical protein
VFTDVRSTAAWFLYIGPFEAITCPGWYKNSTERADIFGFFFYWWQACKLMRGREEETQEGRKSCVPFVSAKHLK